MALHAKTGDIIRINEKLKTVIRKGENGFCEYIDKNITDETVAKGLNVAQASVARIRKELFGMLMSAKGGHVANARLDELVTNDAAKTQQLAECQRQIEGVRELLSHAFSETAKAHNAVCSALSLNRVADVRNLQIDAASILARINSGGMPPYRR
jgi:hypothetical protein